MLELRGGDFDVASRVVPPVQVTCVVMLGKNVGATTELVTVLNSKGAGAPFVSSTIPRSGSPGSGRRVTWGACACSAEGGVADSPAAARSASVSAAIVSDRLFMVRNVVSFPRFEQEETEITETDTNFTNSRRIGPRLTSFVVVVRGQLAFAENVDDFIRWRGQLP